MNVVLLMTGRSVAASAVDDNANRLREAAGGEPLTIDLVTWGPVDGPALVDHAVALGPLADRTQAPAPRTAPPAAPAAPASGGAAPTADQDAVGDAAVDAPEDPPAPDAVEAATSGGTASPGEPETVAAAPPVAVPAPAATPAPAPAEPAPAHARPQPAMAMHSAPALVRRLVWALRMSPPYQSVRRLVRGGIQRQFARRAAADPYVRRVVAAADVVVAVDTGSIPAAWRIARAVEGPAVVNGLMAAVRIVKETTAARRAEDVTASSR